VVAEDQLLLREEGNTRNVRRVDLSRMVLCASQKPVS